MKASRPPTKAGFREPWNSEIIPPVHLPRAGCSRQHCRSAGDSLWAQSCLPSESRLPRTGQVAGPCPLTYSPLHQVPLLTPVRGVGEKAITGSSLLWQLPNDNRGSRFLLHRATWILEILLLGSWGAGEAGIGDLGGAPTVIAPQLLNVVSVLFLPDRGFPKAQLASALKPKSLNSVLKAEGRHTSWWHCWEMWVPGQVWFKTH